VRHLGFELSAREILAILQRSNITARKKENTNLPLITEVPNVNNIAVNHVYAVFQGAPGEFRTRPEITPIPCIVSGTLSG
jgi:hypothetical protein